MDKISLKNQLFDHKKTEEIESSFLWFYKHWKNFKDSFPENETVVFFESFFRDFCKKYKNYEKNNIQMLLAISLSSKIDDINDILSKFTNENQWAKLMRGYFDKVDKIKKYSCSYEIEKNKGELEEEKKEIFIKTFLLGLNSKRIEIGLPPFEFIEPIIKNYVFYEEIEICNCNSSHFIKNAIDEKVSLQNILKRKILKVSLEIEYFNNNTLKCFTGYK